MKRSKMKRNFTRSIQLVKSIHQLLDRNKFLQANTRLLLALSGGQDSITLLSLFLQRKNQRRYKVGLCWCHHLWRCDAFHAMHHLMRLSFTVGEPLYLMIEPTIDPRRLWRKGRAGGDSKKINGRALLTFYASLLCSGGKKEASLFFTHFTESIASHRSRSERGDALIEDQIEDQEKRRPSFTEEGARSWRYQSCQRIATFHRYRILQVGHTASDRIETGLFNLLRGGGMKGVAAIQWNRVLRRLYPKHFSFSNFYGITFEKFE